MRLRTVLLTCVLAAAAVVGGVPAATVAHGAPAASTAFTMVTVPDAPSLDDFGGTFAATGGQVNVTSRSRRELILSENRMNPGRAVLVLTAPRSGSFAPDTTYPVAKRADVTHAAVAIRPTDCAAASSGTVAFAAMTFRSGAISTADGSYSVQCAASRVSGVFHVRSNTLWSAVVGRGFDSNVGRPELGATREVTATFAAIGTVPAAAHDVTVSGVGAPDVTVLADTCSGVSLPTGATCTVTISIRPLLVGIRAVVLSWGDDGRVATAYAVYDPATGTYYATPTPQRILDTRTSTGGNPGRLKASAPILVNISKEFLPIGASAVVVNVTAVDPSAAGYLSTNIYLDPAGAGSSVNFAPGQTVANLVTMAVEYNRINLRVSAGDVHVVVDLVGWYAADNYSVSVAGLGRGGGYHPTTQTRVLDTRIWGHGQIPPGARAVVPVHVRAQDTSLRDVAVNVTVVNASAPGYVTAYDATSESPPSTSTLNFTAGSTVSNATIARVSSSATPCTTDHAIAIVNQSASPIDVLLDVSGWYDDGTIAADIRLRPRNPPTRIADTRSATGISRLGPGGLQDLTPPASVTDYDTVALSTNITAIAPTESTYVSAWPAATERPATSLSNPVTGSIVASHADTVVGRSGAVSYYNDAGFLDVIVDLTGTFQRFPATPAEQQTTPRPSVTLSEVVPGPTAPFPAS